jgi:hypothetical protein
MGVDFWYSDIKPNTFIRESIEKIDDTILFKNIDTDSIDTTKLNILIFQLETEWTNSKKIALTHSKEFIELLIKLQNNNFYFIADNSGCAEHWIDGVSLNFHKLLESNKINFNRIIIANNDSSKIGINKVRYGSNVLNTCFFPNFFLSTYNNLKSYVTDLNPNITPDKKFLCLNRRMYYKKYKIIEELYNKDLLGDTRFTWVDNNIRNRKLNKNLLLELNIDLNNFKPIQLEEDVVYGDELIMEKYLYTINPKWYYKSKVNIIVETTLYPNSIHMTEKIWKAIYLGVPFVVYSPSKNYLKALQDMGFKTFDSVINEDYDEIDGDNKIKQIIKSADALADIYNSPEVLEICKFNQELYLNSEYRKEICKNLFIAKLYDVQKQDFPVSLI